MSAMRPRAPRPHTKSPANTAGNHVALTPFEPGAGRAGKAQQPAARRCRFDSGSNSPILSRKKCLRVALFAPKQPRGKIRARNSALAIVLLQPMMDKTAQPSGHDTCT